MSSFDSLYGTAAAPRVDTTSCPSGWSETAAQSDALASRMRNRVWIDEKPVVDKRPAGEDQAPQR